MELLILALGVGIGLAIAYLNLYFNRLKLDREYLQSLIKDKKGGKIK